MVAPTDVSICNIALLLLGVSKITALADATDRAVLCAALYPETKRETLQSHPWNEALVRTTLYAFTEPAGSLTLSAASGTAVTVEASGSVSFVGKVGYRIFQDGGPGRGTITAVTDADTCTLDINTSGTAFDDLTLASGDWRLYTPAPSFEFSWQLALPSDYLRVHRVANHQTVRREGAWLLSSDTDTVALSYIADIAESLFGPALVWATAYNLAIKLAEPITGQAAKTELFTKIGDKMRQESRTTDGQEGTPEEFESNQLLDVRW